MPTPSSHTISRSVPSCRLSVSGRDKTGDLVELLARHRCRHHQRHVRIRQRQRLRIPDPPALAGVIQALAVIFGLSKLGCTEPLKPDGTGHTGNWRTSHTHLKPPKWRSAISPN